MIEWTEFEAKSGKKDNNPKVIHYHGRVGKMSNAVIIQPPTRYNTDWRVFTMLRWNDNTHIDCESLEKAKEEAERAVKKWLDDSGLTIA